MKFYNVSAKEAVESLATSDSGLTPEEASKRLAEYGRNELDKGKKRNIILKFFDQFKDIMIIVLLVAAVVSAVIAIVQKEYADLLDAGIILLIVIVNAIIGLVQSEKAEAALEALKNMNKPICKVIRGGEVVKVKSEELVPGDIVVLEAGDVVPADIRLIETASMKIEEAALTGESVPTEKDCEAICPEDAPLGDRKNMAYSTGIVTYGRGKGVVTATGMKTEVGKIAKMLSEADNEDTPLQKQLAKTAKVLSAIVLIIAVIIFAASLYRGWGGNMVDVIIESFMTAVAIAVAAIPEGLPAVVTIVLAIGVQRMSERRAIIRHLPAVETLGCCEVICSDKTGTLTLNQMTVKGVFTLSAGSYEVEKEDKKADYSVDLLIKGMVLCNDTVIGEDGKLLGDPTETALVAYAQSLGLDAQKIKNENERINEIPFDSKRKLMSTVNKGAEATRAYIKGAPDILIEKCSKILDGENIRPITQDDIKTISEANKGMAKKALRVLAVAIKIDNIDKLETLEQDMIFVGLVGMIDPPRPEVKEAVRVCRRAGMRPIMITGDHVDTASAIAKEIGILRHGDWVITGAELDKMSDEEFHKNLHKYRVFARVSPENKVRIVKAFKTFKKIVAMTGDGVNDAPSIKSADIGIGMGITGTDVSKGAADMVLADDNFATIIAAVEEGRKVYANITKAIQFLLSANIAEVLCLFISTVFLTIIQPDLKFLTPVMILWVNLVTDSLPALALGKEPAEKDIMDYPPRKTGQSLFAGKIGRDILIQGIMQTGLVMLAFCIGAFVMQSQHPWIHDNKEGMTMGFITLCFIQLFHAYNMRSQTHTIFNKRFFKNGIMNIAFLVGAALTVLAAYIDVWANTEIFGTVALTPIDWLICIACAFAIVPLVEIQKIIENAVKKAKEKKSHRAEMSEEEILSELDENFNKSMEATFNEIYAQNASSAESSKQ